MSDGSDMGPDETINAAFIAKRYFVDRATKVEIADQLKLSRFKVARILDDAVASGIVSISVQTPGPVDLDLSVELRTRLGLRRAIVVTSLDGDPEKARELIAPIAAALLTETVVEDDVLGVTTGRTVQHVARHVSSLAGCDVVQLTGVSDPEMDNGLEPVGRLSQLSAGRGFSLYAPQMVSDVRIAEGLRRQPSIQRTMARFDDVSVALVTIGSWNPPDSQLFENFMSSKERDDLVARGVVAEVCATLFAADGRMIQSVENRSISITERQLSMVRDVIAVAGGRNKVVAIRAAALSGIISTLVTDSWTAQHVLALS